MTNVDPANDVAPVTLRAPCRSRFERPGATLQSGAPQGAPATPSARGIEIEKCASEHDELIEKWARVTDEPALRVVATRLRGDCSTWEITVSAARHVEADPLRSTLDRAILASLTALPGVFDAFQEGREIWMVHGKVEADALIGACSVVLEELADALRDAAREHNSDAAREA